MARKSATATQSRTPLNKARVARTAITLADAGGVAAVTMRKVAEALGVEAMSLYHHVANKGEILDGMVDAVFGEIELPSGGAHWKAAMRQRAESARQVLLRHSWAISLMDSRTNPGAATLRHHDSVLGVLRQAGFSVAQTAHAVSLIDSYLYGFLLQELGLPFKTAEDLQKIAGAILEQMPAGDYPHLAELMTQHALQPGYAYANEFGFGLELILNGLERQRSQD